MRTRGGKAFVYGEPFITSGGAPQWSPTQLSPTIWLDAADAGTITIGTGVSAWANKGAAGGAYAQAVGANQPSYSASDLGYPGVRFDGVNDALTMAGFSFTEMEMAVVFRSSTWPGGSWAIYEFGNSPSSSHHPLAADQKVYDTSGTTTRKDAITPGVQFDSQTIIGVRSKPSDWQMYVNGTSVYSTASNTVGYPATFYLGRSGAGSAAYDGVIREVIMRTTAFTSTERSSLVTYLKAKWGVP